MQFELSALSRRRFLGLTGAASLGLLGACGAQTPSAGSRAGGGAVEPMTISTCVYAKNHASSSASGCRTTPGWTGWRSGTSAATTCRAAT